MTAVSGRPSHAKVHTSGIIVPDFDIHEALLLEAEDSDGINVRDYSGKCTSMGLAQSYPEASRQLLRMQWMRSRYSE